MAIPCPLYSHSIPLFTGHGDLLHDGDAFKGALSYCGTKRSLKEAVFLVALFTFRQNLHEIHHPHGDDCGRRGGLMVSALDSGSNGPGSSPGLGTTLCSWERHFTLIVPLSTQVYKWVPAILLLGVTLRWTGIPSRSSRGE